MTRKSTEQLANEFINQLDLVNRKVKGPEHHLNAVRRGLAEFHMNEAWNEARMPRGRCWACGLPTLECSCPHPEDL